MPEWWDGPPVYPAVLGAVHVPAALSAAAFSLWYYLLKYNKAGEITLYRFVIPVSGAVLSALVLPGESLSPAALVALALVAFGIAAVNRWRKPETSPLDRDKFPE